MRQAQALIRRLTRENLLIQLPCKRDNEDQDGYVYVRYTHLPDEPTLPLVSTLLHYVGTKFGQILTSKLGWYILKLKFQQIYIQVKREKYIFQCNSCICTSLFSVAAMY